jgi:membrane protein YdbS with pleckstrin-like domain
MKTNKNNLLKGLKYEAIALPLLLVSPILISIGFKAIKHQQNYWWLVAGIVLAFMAIIIGFLGIKILLNALFDKN